MEVSPRPGSGTPVGLAETLQHSPTAQALLPALGTRAPLVHGVCSDNHVYPASGVVALVFELWLWLCLMGTCSLTTPSPAGAPHHLCLPSGGPVYLCCILAWVDEAVQLHIYGIYMGWRDSY